MSSEERLFAVVQKMVDALASTQGEDWTILTGTQEVLDSLDDRPVERKLHLLATLCATMLKMLTVRNPDTTREEQP